MKVKPLHILIFILAIAGGLWLLHPGKKDVAGMKEMTQKPMEAITLYEAHLKEFPNDIETLQSLADLHHYMGHQKETLHYLLTLRKLSPDTIKHRHALVDYYRDHIKPEKLVKELEDLQRILLKEPETHKELIENNYNEIASLHVLLDNGDDHLRLLKELITLNPKDREIRMEYLDTLLKRDKRNVFLTALYSAAEQFPDDPMFPKILVEHQLNEGNLSTAEKVASDFLKKGGTLALRKTYLSILRRQLTHTDKREAYLQESLKAFQISPEEFGIEDALTLALEHKDFPFVHKGLDIWKETLPKSPLPWNFHLEKLAPAQGMGGETLARLYLAASLRMPKRLNYKVDAAYLLMEAEDWPKAQRLWEKIVPIKPHHEYHNAYLECLSHTSPQSYSQELIEAYDLYPDDRTIALRYAEEMLKNKKWARALPIYKTFSNLTTKDPAIAEAYINALLRAGKPSEAYTTATEAAKKFPDNEALLTSCAELAEIEKRYKLSADYWFRLRVLKPDKKRYLEGQLRTLALLKDKTPYLKMVKKLDAKLLSMLMLRDAAFIAQEQGHYPLAITLWNALIAGSPTTFSYHENRLFCFKAVPRDARYMTVLFETAHRFPDKPTMSEAIYAGIAATIPAETVSALINAAEGVELQSPENQIAMADGYGYTGQPDKQLTLLKKLHTSTPENQGVMRGLARFYLSAKNWEYAKTVILRLMDRSRTDPRNVALRKELAKATGEWAYLIPVLKAALNDKPGDEAILQDLAYYYSDRKKNEQALPYFKQLHTVYPDNPKYRDELISLYIEMKQPKEAIKVLDDQQENLDVDQLLFLADLHQQTGNPDRADTLRTSLIGPQTETAVLHAIATSLMNTTNLSNAEKAYTAILNRDHNDTTALRAMGQLLGRNHRPDQAHSYYERYLKLKPQSPEIHLTRADLYRKSTQDDKAALHYTAALKQLNDGVSAEKPALLKARALTGLNRPREAIPYYQEALAAHPDDGYLWTDYADILLQTGRYSQTTAVLAKAPKEPQYFIRTFSLWAQAFFKEGRYRDAEAIHRIILKCYPETTDSALQIAYLRELQGDWQEALSHYQTVWTGKQTPASARLEAEKQMKRLEKEYKPYLSMTARQVKNGKDANRLAKLSYRTDITDQLELEGAVIYRSLSGAGLATYPAIDADWASVEHDLIWHPGNCFTYSLGLTIDGGESSIWGAGSTLSYKQASWLTSMSYAWHEAVFDPIALSSRDGVQDALRWQTSWWPSQEISLDLNYAWVHQYLLDPPSGGPEDFFEYTSITARAEYQVLALPHCRVFYELDWMDGDQDPFYVPLLSMAEERVRHCIGLSLAYAITENLSLYASYAIGLDKKRDIDLGDYELYTAGITYHYSDTLEFSATYLNSTETLTGNTGDYTEAEVKAIWRF